MAKLVKKAAELAGCKIAIDGVNVIECGYVTYKNKDGKETDSHTLFTSQNFAGDKVGETADGQAIIVRGSIFVRPSRVVNEKQAVGKAL